MVSALTQASGREFHSGTVLTKNECLYWVVCDWICLNLKLWWCLVLGSAGSKMSSACTGMLHLTIVQEIWGAIGSLGAKWELRRVPRSRSATEFPRSGHLLYDVRFWSYGASMLPTFRIFPYKTPKKYTFLWQAYSPSQNTSGYFCSSGWSNWVPFDS